LVFDADHHHRGDVGVGPGADQGAEVQVQVGAELQPPVGVRKGHRALDVVLHREARGVGKVVDGQDDDVVPHADAAVLALVSPESRFAQVHLDFPSVHVVAENLGTRMNTDGHG
jgi:hypothetical protein